MMPGRLPRRSDFPSSVILSVTPPPAPHCPASVLILLHGLGDTLAPFTRLAQQLALPETACIALQGPAPLPFDLDGFRWGDDMLFDEATGEMDLDTGFEDALRIVERDVIAKGLVENCGFRRREIVLMGYGQGAMAALAVAAADPSAEELGGVISIAGPLPASAGRSYSRARKPKTPVLLLGGRTKTRITAAHVETVESVFEYVDYRRWDRPGDGMPSSRAEMLPIMQFLARRLRSQSGVPDGSVEMT
ncbi:MAG: hypothetical protein M1832_002752 [Thelocarpon impressellum]|nr:MAG: hypothetical protein M1832_002752 [Thelocarpon impressellum]